MTLNLRRRSAFTLVEMLVASALIIFMMYVIASAFEKGLNSFSLLKTQGDLQDKLRAAATAIRLDLTAQHFGDGSALSDQRLNDQSWQPPKQGYFRMWLPGSGGTWGAGVPEGTDPDGNAAYYGLTYNGGPTANNKNTVKDLYLQFTVNLTNGHPAIRDARARADQFFTTNIAALNQYSTPDYNVGLSGTFTSYWAEVTYFAKPNGATTDGQTPLFDLYRRQKMLVEPQPYPNTSGLAAEPAYSAAYTDVSGWQNVCNGPADVTEPFRRWSMNPSFASAPQGLPVNAANDGGPFPNITDEAGLTDQRAGGDLLLTNVVNFEVKVLWDPVVAGAANATRFNTAVTGNFTAPSATNNPDYPFDQLPYGLNRGLLSTKNPLTSNSPRVFDTWSSNNDPAITNGQGQLAQSFGTPIAGPNVQQEYGGWNQGHFTPITGGSAQTPSLYTIPLRVRVRALQIKLRIWDQKTNQTRQMTIIQDM